MDRSRKNAHLVASVFVASVSACAATTLIATSARADTPPNLWDAAKNPDALDQHRQHVEIERRIDLSDELEGDPLRIIEKQSAEDAARMLTEVWHGPKDAWLEFDDAWVAMKRGDFARAVTILEPLSKSFGTSMFSQEVWQKLAECYVNLERTNDEIHAYDEVLARSMNESQRVTPLMNQGEAIMRSGDANAALAQFREVAGLVNRVTNPSDISMLVQWDIAIALDRSGDFRGALEASVAAVRMSKYAVLVISPLYPGVYFVPRYERDWYTALADAGLALNEQDKPSAVALLWTDAEKHMRAYVNGAAAHGDDKWLDLARTRLETYGKRREDAQKRAGLPVTHDVDL
jgi:tetratricopeptide (TPR) repeat protein